MKTRKKIVREPIRKKNQKEFKRKGITYCTTSTAMDRHLPHKTPNTPRVRRNEKTRSLGARWAPTSSWRPFGPKGSVDQG